VLPHFYALHIKQEHSEKTNSAKAEISVESDPQAMTQSEVWSQLIDE